MFKLELVENYKDLLKECFSTDKNLIEKWHIDSGKDIDACVEKTFNDLQDCKVNVYQITNDDELVGYFGKEDCEHGIFLTGFFLLPKFRTEEYKKEFWHCIALKFKEPYFCGLYEKNVPANKFIKSSGGVLVKSTNISNNLVSVYRMGA